MALAVGEYNSPALLANPPLAHVYMYLCASSHKCNIHRIIHGHIQTLHFLLIFFPLIRYFHFLKILRAFFFTTLYIPLK